jgi:HlyD family secretion protein
LLRLGLLAAAIACIGVIVFQFYRARAVARLPKYEMAAVAKGDLRVTITATGRIQALTTVEVGAEVSGRLLRVLVDYNDVVKKGQVLAEIDPEQLRAAVAQANAQAAVARAAITDAKAAQTQAHSVAARARLLEREGVLSKQDLDAADATKARADAAVASAVANAGLANASLALAKYRLDRSVIVSPVDGVVLARLVEAGQTVTAGFQTPVLFKLAEDLTQMALHIDIDEADIGRAREGQEASFTVDAYAGRAFPSRVKALRNEPKISQNVVTYEGLLAVDNHERLLRPGMTATATIVVETKREVLLVPNAALRFSPHTAASEPGATTPVSRSGERQAWIVSAGKPRRVSLHVGGTDGQVTEVVGGELAAGTQVIVDEED